MVNTTVYAIIRYVEYEGSDLIAIADSLDIAQEIAKEYINKYDRRRKVKYCTELKIIEYPLNKLE